MWHSLSYEQAMFASPPFPLLAVIIFQLIQILRYEPKSPSTQAKTALRSPSTLPQAIKSRAS
jgi:hypothetical protein